VDFGLASANHPFVEEIDGSTREMRSMASAGTYIIGTNGSLIGWQIIRRKVPNRYSDEGRGEFRDIVLTSCNRSLPRSVLSQIATAGIGEASLPLPHIPTVASADLGIFQGADAGHFQRRRAF
jgi:hypothetical protein